MFKKTNNKKVIEPENQETVMPAIHSTPIENETVIVKFSRSYCGTYGNYQAGHVYTLSQDIYKALSPDCEKVEG